MISMLKKCRHCSTLLSQSTFMLQYAVYAVYAAQEHAMVLSVGHKKGMASCWLHRVPFSSLGHDPQQLPCSLGHLPRLSPTQQQQQPSLTVFSG